MKCYEEICFVSAEYCPVHQGEGVEWERHEHEYNVEVLYPLAMRSYGLTPFPPQPYREKMKQTMGAGL